MMLLNLSFLVLATALPAGHAPKARAHHARAAHVQALPQRGAVPGVCMGHPMLRPLASAPKTGCMPWISEQAPSAPPLAPGAVRPVEPPAFRR